MTQSRRGLLFVANLLLTVAMAAASDESDSPTAAGETLLAREGWTAAEYFPDERYQQCCTAILKGDVPAVESLVSSELDPNKSGKDGMTLLMWAYAADQIEVFEKLLKLGADPNQVMQIGLKPDGQRVARPKPGDCMTLVVFGEASERWRKAVVDNRGDLNAVNAIDLDSVLMAAGRRRVGALAVTQEILKHDRVNLNYQDQFGLTVVMHAVSGGDYRRAVVYLEAGASADCYDCNHEQLIDRVARRWIRKRHLWEEQPEFRKMWQDNKISRPWFEKLVFLLSERGFDLQTAMLSAMRSEEMIDGIPYYEWRRKQRGHLNIGCPGLSNATDEK